jgi:uncharacterized protein YnzC (UPF0291/DUF896 family)
MEKDMERINDLMKRLKKVDLLEFELSRVMKMYLQLELKKE